ncbi:hypothetical protein [Mycobacterium sp. IS-3022]|uniref:hypothetical protein n=1 Tax=Mycobacterium sp. IS-3022 TaxID=1772277 RepID=UPI0007416B6C|nr:hypothetical protein [Mycobacterium sp. IS-3022]KUI02844.1 hypothetical protein AU188_23660 [Mycobacterium sp. IS-3022]
MTNDVEKRWDKPSAFRAAATYVAVVVAVAAVAFVIYAVVSKTSVVGASTVPAILLLGGLGAFVKTYREWKAQGQWVQWQGAGWFLLLLMLVCLSIPGAAAMAD